MSPQQKNSYNSIKPPVRAGAQDLNTEGQQIGRGRLSGRGTFKRSKPIPVCGISIFGGSNRDRTDDFTDAKRYIKLFCMISNYLWCFLLGFSFFPPLFRTLISMCYAAVCGASYGQKRSLPFAGSGFPTWTGSIFASLTAWIVTLRAELSK